MEYQESFCVTAFIKSVVARSQRRATVLTLPICCTEEALEYAANESPSLKALRLHDDLLFKKSTIIPKLISKWKNLEMLSLGSRHNMEEILAQISLHCNNFIMLFAPQIYVGKDEATAIVTSLPNLKYLVLKGSTIEWENLVMVLQGCKKLLRLDVRKCIGFEKNDAEILALASHIPTFMCKGSILYDYDDEPLTYKDADFAPDDHYCVSGWMEGEIILIIELSPLVFGEVSKACRIFVLYKLGRKLSQISSLLLSLSLNSQTSFIYTDRSHHYFSASVSYQLQIIWVTIV
uniref:F-box/LRR-repeat protein n=1 Tax=Vitis vinifera TaxID=29760 RepID=F6I3L5_VITVI